ncbi:PilZ domain-containing protein [Zoogloea sp.]|uniref:PilZ domain-containing protein n=1 Tax=Zoogloea sp. TaxID=49181 RepID=UPI0035AFD712
MSKHENASGAERRKRQRFVATRWGNVCFWVEIDGVRQPVNDLSLEGFSLSWGVPLPEPLDLPFVLHLEGIPDQIRGTARTVNFVLGAEGGLLGCRFLSFEGDGAERLHEWLTIHVISTATIRISETEAAAIVSGPSLV